MSKYLHSVPISCSVGFLLSKLWPCFLTCDWGILQTSACWQSLLWVIITQIKLQYSEFTFYKCLQCFPSSFLNIPVFRGVSILKEHWMLYWLATAYGHTAGSWWVWFLNFHWTLTKTNEWTFCSELILSWNVLLFK